jgi:hypothetical protein
VTINERALAGLRDTLAAEDYAMSVRQRETRVLVRITAGPLASSERLVPKTSMLSVLTDALGVPGHSITLIYPTDRVLYGPV